MYRVAWEEDGKFLMIDDVDPQDLVAAIEDHNRDGCAIEYVQRSGVPIISVRPMSQESFEHLLIEIRNAASRTLTGLALEGIKDEQRHDAKIEDVRAVWHAAEVALGILITQYMPKKETEADVRALLRRY